MADPTYRAIRGLAKRLDSLQITVIALVVLNLCSIGMLAAWEYRLHSFRKVMKSNSREMQKIQRGLKEAETELRRFAR